MFPPNTVSLPNIHIPKHKNTAKKIVKNVSILQYPQMADNSVIDADGNEDDNVDGVEGEVGDEDEDNDDGSEDDAGVEDIDSGGKDDDDAGSEDDAVAGDDFNDGNGNGGGGSGGMDDAVRRGRWQG